MTQNLKTSIDTELQNRITAFSNEELLKLQVLKNEYEIQEKNINLEYTKSENLLKQTMVKYNYLED